jgi:septum formation protein
MSKIVLASSSPRRKELLKREGIDFMVDASCIDEILDESLPLKSRLMKLSYDKGEPIHKKYPKDIVISADTTVFHNDEIIGKASDKEEARRILLSLSNDKQIVFTSVTIFKEDMIISFIDETAVYFKDIEGMIDDYLLHDEWKGKAGAYAIQGMASKFVDHIEGDIDTVIGLPVKRVVELI